VHGLGAATKEVTVATSVMGQKKGREEDYRRMRSGKKTSEHGSYSTELSDQKQANLLQRLWHKEGGEKGRESRGRAAARENGQRTTRGGLGGNSQVFS